MHFARSIVLGYHSIAKINWGSFQGRREEKWRSFWGRYHFGFDLGIISGSGSFRGLCKSGRVGKNVNRALLNLCYNKIRVETIGQNHILKLTYCLNGLFS